MDERLIIDLARQQHGLVHRSQVHDAGGGDGLIQHRLEIGQWEAVRRGVYGVGATSRTWARQAMAALLAAGPDTAVGLRSGARALGLVARSGRLQLVIAGDRRVRLAGVEVHRSSSLRPEEIVVADGLRTTSVERPLIDLAPFHDAATLGRWIDAALQSPSPHLDLDLGRLARRTSELTIPGRPVPTSLMDALSIRQPGHDPGRSAFEARVLAAYARRGLPTPACQHPVTRPDGSTAHIDIAYPQDWVAIELDGWETHGIRGAFDADRIRGNDLVLLGYRLLRFTWSMSDDLICDMTETALRSARPLPPARSISIATP